MDEKTKLIEKSDELKKRHEAVKNEMLKILDASKILDEQYKTLEKELYEIEDNYINIIKELA